MPQLHTTQLDRRISRGPFLPQKFCDAVFPCYSKVTYIKSTLKKCWSCIRRVPESARSIHVMYILHHKNLLSIFKIFSSRSLIGAGTFYPSRVLRLLKSCSACFLSSYSGWTFIHSHWALNSHQGEQFQQERIRKDYLRKFCRPASGSLVVDSRSFRWWGELILSIPSLNCLCYVMSCWIKSYKKSGIE